MWGNLLGINSALLALAAAYFIYAAGRGALLLEWKQALIALLILGFFAGTQLVCGALAD